MSKAVLNLIAGAMLLALPRAQQWVSLETTPFGRTHAATATDPRTGRMLLFGGTAAASPVPWTGSDILWQWTGDRWVRHGVGAAPPARTAAAMALDSGRGRVVLFGGRLTDGMLANDTWEWDGDAWHATTPGVWPPASATHALAYDARRGRTVAFGGGLSPWTFQWDGTNWQHATPANTPLGRVGMTLVFDPVRGRVFLFGGLRSTQFARTYGNDLWQYDGVDWSPVFASPRPTARAFHSATWDARRNRMVVFGGERDLQQLLNDTWEWDGGIWQQATPTASPPPQWSLAMQFDHAQQRTVLHSAITATGTSTATTWHWDGTTWSTIGNASPCPGSRSLYGFVQAPPPGACLLFGGRGQTESGGTYFGDTWLWQGGSWRRAQPTTVPQGRTAFGMAYDSGRRRVVMFGGAVSGTVAADTWEWNGTNWLQRTTGTQPPPVARWHTAMAYDPVRAVTVMFGGSDGFLGVFGDAWAWDGTRWSSLPGGPAPRWGHAMTFDATRQQIVLCGGGGLSDLWQWDGTTWTQGVAPPGAPRTNALLFHDPVRGRTVLHGGTRASAPNIGETLEWDGSAWSVVASVLPPTDSAHAAGFDPVLGRTIVFDGTETWAWAVTAATATSTGDPCPGVPGLPTLAAAGRPFVGNPAFGLWIDRAPAASACAALLDLNPATVPLPGGCNVLLAQPQWYALGVVDGSGGLLLPMPLVPSNGLRGVRVLAQAVAAQPGGPMLGWLLPTARLELLLGD